MQGGKFGVKETRAMIVLSCKQRWNSFLWEINAKDFFAPSNQIDSHNAATSSSTLKMSSIEELAKPARVTGGCLCGAVRYRVDFPHDYDFAKNVSEFSLLQSGVEAVHANPLCPVR